MAARELGGTSEAIVGSNPGKRAKRLAIAILAVAAFGAGLVVENVTVRDSGRVGTQSSPYYSSATAIQLVVSTTRPEDGLLFGEWVRDRIARNCPTYAPASAYRFFAFNEPFGWYVYSNLPDGMKVNGTCPSTTVLQYLAIVRHDNGKLANIHPEGEHLFAITSGGRALPPAVPPGVSLLDQFEGGAAP